MSWSLLERFFQSELFNNDPSLAVGYLARYPNHVGIQYVLCNKLRAFAYEEIEFFLPQICHLLVSVDSESMALEEFLIDLCQESVSGALLTFWLFQTHLHDLSSTPQSVHFKVCRRIFNKVQHIVFGASGGPYVEKINDNILPTTVLASIVLTGVAAPFVPRALGPLAIAQARKPRLTDETISEAPLVQTRATRPSRSHTISSSSSSKPQSISIPHQRSGSEAPPLVLGDARLKPSRSTDRKSTRRSQEPRPVSLVLDSSGAVNGNSAPRPSTSSLPEIPRRRSPQIPPDSSSSVTGHPIKPQKDDLRKQSTIARATGLDALSSSEKVHMLRSNYFRNETQFLSALEGISIRLVIVPKAARLSALRAELALVARDLPADVDIPLICPATLDDGSPSRSRHHRVVRINPAEATSLNSAERVPYLLMIEVLRDDFDFNPHSEANQRLLTTFIAEKGSNKRRLFDITPAIRASLEADSQNTSDSVFEPITGDLSSPSLLKSFSDEPTSIGDISEMDNQHFREHTARLSSGTHTMSSFSISTPRSSDTHNSRSNSPGPKKLTLNTSVRPMPAQDPQGVSALATHMRTAAQMLTQLEMSGSKRPRQEVEAIKGKIIASMQTMEEQNFYSSSPSSTLTPNLDTILADVKNEGLSTSTDELDELYDSDDRLPEPGSRGAGAARMENDQKLAGIRRKGDRDDPSAATFGEEWNSKRERIRRSSPFGAMKNWDLLSVIVKTGSDLRQEMFACQLIRICSKIWEDANIPVWVRQMKILVTGESSGLIETITNGVSLHSLKRSLTLSSIASGNNPKKQIATLKDHYVKTFGDVDTAGYKAAADAFMRSLAAYSILCYILQLKDRHNGNMLIDNVGHIIHIDFGFMLSNSPGSVGFEAAPFKLTQEYVDVLGGPTGTDFENYKTLCKEAFQALRKSAENIVSVVEMMGKESKMACFASGGAAYVTNSLRQRFCLHLSKQEAEGFVEELIAKSLGSYYTRLYDNYQYRIQGIY